MKTILKKPVITEKATAMNENGVYVFIVDKKATKAEIKTAVEKMYADQDAKVVKVRTAIIFGKPKYRYLKTAITKGHTSTYKKAFVQLAEGSTIDIFDTEEN